MPKALIDFLGYAIYFWLNENEPLEPVHVHVAKGKPTPNATKVWITRSGVRLEHNNSKIPRNELKEILSINPPGHDGKTSLQAGNFCNTFWKPDLSGSDLFSLEGNLCQLRL